MSYHDRYVPQWDNAPRSGALKKKKVLKLSIEENFFIKHKSEINMLDDSGVLKHPKEIIRELMMYLERVNHES